MKTKKTTEKGVKAATMTSCVVGQVCTAARLCTDRIRTAYSHKSVSLYVEGGGHAQFQ